MAPRKFLKGLRAALLAGLFLGLYSFFVEPALRLRVTRWRIKRTDWQVAPLRIAILTDLHGAVPHVRLGRLRRFVTRTNALGADLIVVLGDLQASHQFQIGRVPVAETVRVLARLKAPLGVYAVTGKHG